MGSSSNLGAGPTVSTISGGSAQNCENIF